MYVSCFQMSESRESTSKKRKCQNDKSLQPIPLNHLEEAVRDLLQMEDTDSDFSQFDDSFADPNFVLEQGDDTNSEQSELGTMDIPDMTTQDQIFPLNNSLALPEAPSVAGIDIDANISHHHNTEDNSTSHSEEPQPDCEPSEVSHRNYYGRNRYKWSSTEPIVRNTRTQLHNIVYMSRRRAPSTLTSLTELWELFITNNMLSLIACLVAC